MVVANEQTQGRGGNLGIKKGTKPDFQYAKKI